MSAAFIRSLVRTALYFMLIVFTSELNTVSAQNSTTVIFRARQQCPLGFHCFNNTAITVIIKWGHNGHICDGQEAQDCYGETDPLGFVMGPRQIPQTVVQGDKVIFEPELITLKLSNVTKYAYDNCIQSGQFIQNQTTASFEVPNEYLNSPGIKYFINYDNPIYSCDFGIKLELFVRSRQQPNCINHSNPQLGVCSGKGLCASSTDTFFTRNYKCLCMDAYNGTYCEELISCHSSRNPCKNGATCIEINDGIADSFNCICPLGYTGTYCEEDINDCVLNPCQNGGFCTDGVNSYTCLCQSGFNGKNCSDIIPNSCMSEPCKNGGTCERSGEKKKILYLYLPSEFHRTKLHSEYDNVSFISSTLLNSVVPNTCATLNSIVTCRKYQLYIIKSFIHINLHDARGEVLQWHILCGSYLVITDSLVSKDLRDLILPTHISSYSYTSFVNLHNTSTILFLKS